MPNAIRHTEESGLVQKAALADIEARTVRLEKKLSRHVKIQPNLTRQLVSFQANKELPGYRWYKYKEAFSASLVDYFAHRYHITEGPILDPFAGMGTTLFAATNAGLEAVGIELLPIGSEIIQSRVCLQRNLSDKDLATLRRWRKVKPWRRNRRGAIIPTLRITNGAYPAETLEAMGNYVRAWESEDARIQKVLRFVLLCVLESISYTRKDGQYLRWDDRSGRRLGTKPFDKGRILPFDEAITGKMDEILSDLARPPSNDLFSKPCTPGTIRLIPGSCLAVLPGLPSSIYRAIITSPPYCNRYDYTRTYALELALLGVDEQRLLELRQQMLSCTVENRAKDLITMHPAWAKPIDVANHQGLLQSILCYLEDLKHKKELNNLGIPRMVRGYFYEMACVIAECSRVLKSRGMLIMVNDNVRYAGASIAVDLILSDLAESLGLEIENILVLPNGKGNSSQQMGVHGRDPLRKCVYVWRKP